MAEPLIHSHTNSYAVAQLLKPQKRAPIQRFRPTDQAISDYARQNTHYTRTINIHGCFNRSHTYVDITNIYLKIAYVSLANWMDKLSASKHTIPSIVRPINDAVPDAIVRPL